MNYSVNNNHKSKHPLHILIADDDVDDRDLFSEALAECNSDIIVHHAANGNELLNLLTNAIILPDLVFLDLNMPGKDGKECLRDIRLSPVLKAIPVIIYSTSLSQKDIDDTYELGANLYISKPNTFQDLVKVLKAFLSLDKQMITGRSRKNYILNSLHQP